MRKERHIMYLKEDAIQERQDFLKNQIKQKRIQAVQHEEFDGIFIIMIQKDGENRPDFYDAALVFLRDLKGDQPALSVITQRDVVNCKTQLYVLPEIFLELIEDHAEHYAKSDDRKTKVEIFI